MIAKRKVSHTNSYSAISIPEPYRGKELSKAQTNDLVMTMLVEVCNRKIFDKEKITFVVYDRIERNFEIATCPEFIILEGVASMNCKYASEHARRLLEKINDFVEKDIQFLSSMP